MITGTSDSRYSNWNMDSHETNHLGKRLGNDLDRDCPQTRYAQALCQGLSEDHAQAEAISALQRIHDDIMGLPGRRGRRRRAAVRGLYMWGGVGRGKTFLMDMFYDSLPKSKKTRQHFHRFMRDVHGQLQTLKDKQNPLDIVADRIYKESRTICFDEFFVSDIGDAMILGGLFQALFQRGITLIATSNIPPDELYKNGLQRARFMPTIELLKANADILNVDGGTDYRLRALTKAKLFHSPVAESEPQLQQAFAEIGGDETGERSIEVNNRCIEVERRADGVVWFTFAQLCCGPRAPADYIEIAREHHTVILSAVPVLDEFKENEARRFINMVDEFYDRGVKLILSADVPMEELYQGGRVQFEFQRTLSRLTEMQSQEYLQQPHIP